MKLLTEKNEKLYRIYNLLESSKKDEIEHLAIEACENALIKKSSELHGPFGEGYKEGFRKGFVEGFIEGYIQKALKSALELIENGYSIELAARITDLPIEAIKTNYEN